MAQSKRLELGPEGLGLERRSLPPAGTNVNVKRSDVVTNSHNRPAHQAGRKEIGTYMFIAHLIRTGHVDLDPTPDPLRRRSLLNGVHTLVVAGKIKRGGESDYERWVGKLVTTLHDTPGYNGMTAISSPDSPSSVGTLLIRFLSAEALSEWEDSPVRHSLIEEGDQFSASYYHAGAGQEV